MNNFILYDILKNDLDILKGGNNYIGNNYIIIFICIIIIVIGLFLYFNDDLIWLSTSANIISYICNSDSECTFNITYNINNVTYSKQIIADKYYTEKSVLTIYYHESNPNIIKLYNFDYKIFGLSLIIISLIILLHSIVFVSNNETDTNTNNEISLSMSTIDIDNINTNINNNSNTNKIIYTK